MMLPERTSRDRLGAAGPTANANDPICQIAKAENRIWQV